MIIKFLRSCYSILFRGRRFNFRYAHVNRRTSGKLLNKWSAVKRCIESTRCLLGWTPRLPPPFVKPPTFIKWSCLFC